jgi:ABC-2 type transport system permease protein
VRRTVLEGKRTPLDSFTVAVAVTISLMFVTVLLAAGMLALEREEHAFARLVRGLVSRSGLLAEKAALAAACALVVSLLMLAGIGIFVSLDWSRFPLWVLGAACGAVAFGALGVAIGGLAREVRAASLLAFLLSLPVAFLALVPSGAVSSGLYDVVRVVSAIFPFKPALQAMTGALETGQPSLLGPLAHLLGLAVAFGVIARLALRRFA